jgi:YegS/Rv2252/BmrU family lipid kinase
MCRAVVIFNPYAGISAHGSPHATLATIKAAVSVWENQGWQIALNPTGGPGDATRLARAAACNHYDMVVAAGGDGTINEVVNGLAGSSTVLATLPLGTMNVWARELKLPLQPRAAAEAMRDWKPRTIDLGRAGDRYFLLMAGIGFDAAITSGIRPEEKRRLGGLAYVLLGLKIALHMRGTRVRLVLDGKKVRGRVLMIVVGNTQLYGGLARITQRASIDDGLLDVVVLKGDGLWSGVWHAISILQQRYSLNPDMEYYRARHISVAARPVLPVQVDGEPLGQTPMTFEAAADALCALLPPDLPDGLMSRPAVAAPRTRGLHRLTNWLRHHRPQSADTPDSTDERAQDRVAVETHAAPDSAPTTRG